jgi:photosystem II stability/assembly factor-like uncharacterized protein
VKPSPSNLNGIAFGGNGTGLIVGNRGTILRSDDAGAHWTPLRISLSHTINGVN